MMKRVVTTVVLALLTSAVLAQEPFEYLPEDIATFLRQNEGFSVISTILEDEELARSLTARGPFTFFAPTDEAFASLSEDELEELLGNKGALRRLLLRHLVRDEVRESRLREVARGNGKFASEGGADLGVSMQDAVIFLDGEIPVQATDIETGNGVVHVVGGFVRP